MKALTSAFSLVALLAALVVLPGCGGGDEAVPADGGTVTSPDPIDDGMMLGAPDGDADAMEGPGGEVDLENDPALTTP